MVLGGSRAKQPNVLKDFDLVASLSSSGSEDPDVSFTICCYSATPLWNTVEPAVVFLHPVNTFISEGLSFILALGVWKSSYLVWNLQ